MSTFPENCRQDFFSFLALRGGVYKERFSDNWIFSGGIGLINTNMLFSKDNQFNHSQFMVNYAFVYQQKQKMIFRWHVLSLFIRI